MNQVARPKKAKTFLVLIRPEFKTICQDDACRAGMFNHILYNVARAKQQGTEYWHSTGDDIWEETQRSWGKSKTLKEIKDLVATGLVAQSANPKNSWDRTKYYTFGKEQAKALHDLCAKNKICLASIKFPSAVTHLLNLTNAFCKNNKCICCNQQIDLLDSTDRFVNSEIEACLEGALEADPETPSRTLYKDSIKTVEDKGESLFPDLVAKTNKPTASPSYSQPTSQDEKKKGESTAPRGYTKPKPTQPGRPSLTDGGQAIKDAWVSLFKVKSSVQFGPKSIELANELHQPLSEWAGLLGWTLAATLQDIKNHAFKVDPTYYREKGFNFWNIAQALEGWQSVKQSELEGKKRAEDLRAQLLVSSQPSAQLPSLTAEQWNALKNPKPGKWREERAQRIAASGV